MAARSFRFETPETLSEDLRIALHQLASDVIDLGRVRQQTQLLLRLTLQESPYRLRQVLDSLLHQDLTEPDNPRRAWLLALTGDQARFERLDLEPFGTVDSYHYHSSSEGLLPIPWRHGTQNLMENFFRLATLPELNAAIHFMWPRYYNGPLYHGLWWAVKNNNPALLRLALEDYSTNRDALEWDASSYDYDLDQEGPPEFEAEDPVGFYRDALRLALRKSQWELIEIFLDYDPQEVTDAIRELPVALVELLLRRHPASLLRLLHHPSYPVSLVRKIIRELPQAAIDTHPQWANRAVVSLSESGFWELAVELAARVKELQLEPPYELLILTPARLAARRQNYLVAASKAMRMGQVRVAAALHELAKK